MEYVVRHSKDIKETPTPAYPMNARPHGIALVMVIEEYPDGQQLEGAQLNTQNFIYTFNYLQYTVQPYTNVTSLQMIQLVEHIATMDHTTYDSFVCCISARGRNNHYIHCSDHKIVNIYELVDKVQQCSTLQGKPKLFFISTERNEDKRYPLPISYKIGFDTVIMWAAHKGCPAIVNPTKGSKFIISLQNVFKLESKNTDLLSMTNSVAAAMIMILPYTSMKTGEFRAQCPEIESQLKSKVYFFYEDELPGKYINVIIIETYIIIFIRLFWFTGQSS